jgi:hypothetical protein
MKIDRGVKEGERFLVRRKLVLLCLNLQRSWMGIVI